ncbi:MAG: alpha/beta fold hydrolase [Anaerolineae bacterium]
MTIISTTRGEVHYKDYRPDEFNGVPFVLVHGAGSQYRDYHPQLRRGLPAIALDLPGHGKSPRHDEPISIPNYAQDVIALLDAIALERVILVGHSMGGGIAQQIALDHPERLQGLVLIATGAKLAVNPTIIEGIVTQPQETAELVTQWSWGAIADEALIKQGVEQLLETAVEVIQADYIACDQFDVRERLLEISTPTLIIAGGADKMTRLAWNQALAEGIPNSQLHVFEQCGHMVHAEEPQGVLEAIREWSETL